MQQEQAQAAFGSWLESHTPGQIEAANRARKILRLRLKANPFARRKWASIRDERAVKPPKPAYRLYFVARQASPDFNNIRVVDRTKLIAEEWRALETVEKEAISTSMHQLWSKLTVYYRNTLSCLKRIANVIWPNSKKCTAVTPQQ